MRRTITICPSCHSIIPATTEGLYMRYNCCGAEQNRQIEVDPDFVATIGYGRVEDVYRSFILNITGACNDTCRLCYYPLTGEHQPFEWCIEQAARFPDFGVWLSGGEPTCHPRLFEIIAAMPNFHCVLTNGKRFADPMYLNEFIGKVGFDRNGYLPAVVSIHADPPDYKHAALDNIRLLGVKLNCIMFSIQRVGELPEILELWGRYQDVADHARIRTPFNSWNQKSHKTLYLSKVFKEIKRLFPHFTITERLGGNSIYNVNLEHEGRLLSLCSAPDPAAFDVDACSCSPKMMANDGNLYPTPMALVMNEHTTC